MGLLSFIGVGIIGLILLGTGLSGVIALYRKFGAKGIVMGIGFVFYATLVIPLINYIFFELKNSLHIEVMFEVLSKRLIHTFIGVIVILSLQFIACKFIDYRVKKNEKLIKKEK